MFIDKCCFTYSFSAKFYHDGSLYRNFLLILYRLMMKNINRNEMDLQTNPQIRRYDLASIFALY